MELMLVGFLGALITALMCTFYFWEKNQIQKHQIQFECLTSGTNGGYIIKRGERTFILLYREI
jgi:hypothetical protein